MGLFNFSRKKKGNTFIPDLNKTEYENWLSFLEQGGTSEDWKRLVANNNWKFREDSARKNMQYEKHFRPLMNEYSSSASKIKLEWSIISKENNYTGSRVDSFIELCTHNIDIYEKMVKLENEHHKDHLQEAEGYKRLAMLYEKQRNFEQAIRICIEAIQQGDVKSMPERLARMLKKAHREPSKLELSLINRNFEYNKFS